MSSSTGNIPMFDCRNLIEFCRAFERHHNHTYNPSGFPPQPSKTRRFTSSSLNPFSHEFCDRSPLAALDLILLLLVVGSLGFLTISYFKFFFRVVLPSVHRFVVELILEYPIACFLAVVGLVFGLIVWEMLDFRLRRRCGNPFCKGLRRAVEYDIQLESEECVKYSLAPTDACDEDKLELGPVERDELKAELKKMAPPNGRTVLIFRARCGCPVSRLEVWGPKKVRRIKK